MRDERWEMRDEIWEMRDERWEMRYKREIKERYNLFKDIIIISIYNIQYVFTLEEEKKKGTYRISFTASCLSEGKYLIEQKEVIKE